MYLIAFPLLLIPFALYNMIVFLLNMPFTDTVFAIPLIADQRMPVTTGDLLVAVGMLLLYVEVLKAARFGSKAVMDHVLSFVLFAMAASRAGAAGGDADLLLLIVLSFVRRDHRLHLGVGTAEAAGSYWRDGSRAGVRRAQHEPRLPLPGPRQSSPAREHGGDLASGGEGLPSRRCAGGRRRRGGDRSRGAVRGRRR